MRLACLLAASLVAAAGCAQPAPADSPGRGAVDAGNAVTALPANATLVTVHQAYDLTVTQAMLVLERAGQSGNCLAWPGPFRLLHGNATATWQAATPLANTLDLTAVDDAHGVRNGQTGASPRTVKLDGLGPDTGAYALLQVQVPAPAGVAVQQSVHVVVDFTALAVGAPQPQLVACAV